MSRMREVFVVHQIPEEQVEKTIEIFKRSGSKVLAEKTYVPWPEVDKAEAWKQELSELIDMSSRVGKTTALILKMMAEDEMTLIDNIAENYQAFQDRIARELRQGKSQLSPVFLNLIARGFKLSSDAYASAFFPPMTPYKDSPTKTYDRTQLGVMTPRHMRILYGLFGLGGQDKKSITTASFEERMSHTAINEAVFTGIWRMINLGEDRRE